MTLATVARYDEARISTVGDHAVVIGASIAGLLAGRVLADGFQQVTIIDRDPLYAEAIARRGVPQANHVHVLLEAGRATLEDLFPGYGREVLSSGGIMIDAASDLNHYQKGGFLAQGPERLPMYCASRPLFERVVRERIAELDGIVLRPECRFTDYLTENSTTIEGAVIIDGNGEEVELAADLVVDATGRTSRTPTWLERHHYTPPAVDEVTVDLVYGTTVIERPPNDRRAYFVAPSPPIARGAAAIPVENDRWIVTLFGLHGNHPPADVRGFKEFARKLPISEVHALLDARPWVTEGIHRYPFPSNLRRYYEDLRRFPDGLVVTGDAIASFNPIYGQGMSVAALDALQLHHALASNGRTNLAPRFFDRVAEVIDIVWRIAVSSDFEFSPTEGPKPPGTVLFNRYLSRLIRTAHVDGYVSDRFARVLRLEQPPMAFLKPDVLLRVLVPTAMYHDR